MIERLDHDATLSPARKLPHLHNRLQVRRHPQEGRILLSLLVNGVQLLEDSVSLGDLSFGLLLRTFMGRYPIAFRRTRIVSSHGTSCSE